MNPTVIQEGIKATNPENSITPLLSALTSLGEKLMVVTVGPSVPDKPLRRLEIIGQNAQVDPREVHTIDQLLLLQEQLVEGSSPFHRAQMIGRGPREEPIILLSTGIQDAGQRLEAAFLSTVIAERLRIRIRHSHLMRLATRDQLTQAMNRQGMEIFAPLTEEMASRNGLAVGGLMMDIDHFKEFNTKHGHPGGDAVLTEVAAYIMRTVRKTDLVVRMGGDEFFIFGEIACAENGNHQKGVRKLAQRLLKGIAALEVTLPEGQIARVTVSIGGTYFLPGNGGLAEAIKRADSGLYLAKRAGRNRVRLVTP